MKANDTMDDLCEQFNKLRYSNIFTLVILLLFFGVHMQDCQWCVWTRLYYSQQVSTQDTDQGRKHIKTEWIVSFSKSFPLQMLQIRLVTNLVHVFL